MKFAEEIEICLRSRFTVVWISSYEEERIVTSLKELCERTKCRLLTWDIAACFKVVSDTPGAPSPPDAKDPLTALEAIAKAEANNDAVFVLKDFHHCLDRQPKIIRHLRNLAQALKATRKSIIITAPNAKVPDDLKDDVFLMEFPTFFLDLPTTAERRAIFEVHITKRKRPLAMFDLDELAANSAGFVGAEIEQAVVDAMHLAYYDKTSPRRESTTDDVIAALARLVPLSRSQRERIETLRSWLRDGRAQSASYTEARKHEEQFVQIQPFDSPPPP